MPDDALKNSLPLVSIVINSYNQAAYLEETIKSVLDQDYPNIEVLLVDGGSTDGSKAIIQRYVNRFRWWVSEPDHGQAEGINKGLVRAKGELVAWLNSDDLYLPGTVSAAVKAWQQHPQAALIYGDVLAIDENGRVFNRIKCSQFQLSDLMMFKILNQPAVFMSNAILKEAGYLSTAYHYLLDHQLWLRIAVGGDMVYVHQVWAKGRFHSQAKNLANAEKFGEDAYKIVRFLNQEKLYKDMRQLLGNRIQAGADRINARYLLDAGKPRQAFASYWRGLLRSPVMILPEIHRMIFCLLAMVGLGKLKDVFFSLRRLFHPTKMG